MINIWARCSRNPLISDAWDSVRPAGVPSGSETKFCPLQRRTAILGPRVQEKEIRGLVINMAHNGIQWGVEHGGKAGAGVPK